MKVNPELIESGADAGGGRETLADQAYRLLEDRIVRLELAPGARFTEQTLGAHIAMGRTPVREAIQRLVDDGLLLVFPRKGVMVTLIKPQDVIQALEVRLVLERMIAANAARDADVAQRQALARCADQLLAAAAMHDVDAYMRADRAFDVELGRVSGNPFAVRAVGPLQTMARRAWFYFTRNVDLLPAAERHAALARAVAEGKVYEAVQASDQLVFHIRDGLRRVFDS
ncbi:MAG: GntR family transcriptional regulator [Beijerinckiaceae bacterium]|nr:GntR family transcriptional regulator [Beijerinckiaceae bacterium]